MAECRVENGRCSRFPKLPKVGPETCALCRVEPDVRAQLARANARLGGAPAPPAPRPEFPACIHGGEARETHDMDCKRRVRFCSRDGEDKPICECRTCGGVASVRLAYLSGAVTGETIRWLDQLHSRTHGDLYVWDADTPWPSAGRLCQFAVARAGVRLVRAAAFGVDAGVQSAVETVRTHLLKPFQTAAVLRPGDPVPEEPAPAGPLLIVETGVGLGDALIASGAVRSVRRDYPNARIVVATNQPDVFANNPAVESTLAKKDGDAKRALIAQGWKHCHATQTPGRKVPNYGVWLASRSEAERRHSHTDWGNDPDAVIVNAVTNTTHIINQSAGLHVTTHDRYPAVYLTAAEQAERPTPEPYWILISGAKFTKSPRVELTQAVVDRTRDRIRWVQLGEDGGWGKIAHPDIAGVEDRRAKLAVRDLLRWVYHADGVLCPEGGWMHAAGALGTPCVVLAGGRPTPGFLDYPGQSVFSAVGKLDCCRHYGCWNRKCPPGMDRDCYLTIDPAHVAEVVLWHDAHPSCPPGLATPARVREARLPADTYDAPAYWRERAGKFGMGMRFCAYGGKPDEVNLAIYREAEAVLGAAIDGCQADLSRVLEVGVGNGYWLDWLKRRGAGHYTGLDITDRLFEPIRAAYPYEGVDLIAGDIAETAPAPREGGAFSAVFMLDVTQHIGDNRRFTAALGNATAHLAPGGVLFVTSFCKAGPVQANGRHRALADYEAVLMGWRRRKPTPYRDKFLIAFRKPV